MVKIKNHDVQSINLSTTKENAFKIYPNPTKEHIWIEPINASKNLNQKFDVFNLSGKLIFSSKINSKTKVFSKPQTLLFITDIIIYVF